MASVELITQWVRGALKPEPRLTVSQWSDQYRILSKKSSSEPGKWNTDRTPYLREIMDALSPSHPAKKIVFKKASQVGGTECGNNWIGFVVGYAPGPMMIVQPTVDMARRNSRLRIEPLLEDSPALKSKIRIATSKENVNTVQQKDFEGGTLVMTGANSAAGLRSMPAKYLMLDEVDAYPRDVDGEGDPVSLVLARSRTFSRRKAFLVSTPTFDGLSKIDDEFKMSDRRFFHVPCPHCGKKQKLEFKNLQWTEGNPASALYYCEHCGVGIEERFKTKMLLEGEWIPENPGAETVGFHLNSLYSPLGWYSWQDAATEFEEAKREQEQEKKTAKMKTFINTVLGETYKEPGEAPEWKRIYLRRENYKIGTVPKGVLFLTCGVDVQKDRLECEVVGWGRKKESWSITYVVFRGDTAGEEVWKELEHFITEQRFPHASGAEMSIKLTAVDSGYNTQHVYNFVRKFPPTKVVAIKGHDNLSMLVGLPKVVDAKFQGRAIRRAVKVWGVGVSLLKSELYGWLKLDPPIGEEQTPSGFCHFPEYDEEYFKQLTAEKVVIRRNRKGFSLTEFVKERERNEALDCRTYARAAASMVGLDRFREQDFERFRVQSIAKAADNVNNVNEGNQKQTKEKSPRPKRERESFW